MEEGRYLSLERFMTFGWNWKRLLCKAHTFLACCRVKSPVHLTFVVTAESGEAPEVQGGTWELGLSSNKWAQTGPNLLSLVTSECETEKMLQD